MARTLVVAVLALLVAPRGLVPGQQPVAGCLRYEPDTVSLAGLLRQHTFPGPPNYESIKQGDQPETGYYLHPARPICTIASEVNGAARGVRLVQVVIDSAGYARLRPFLGQQVTLRGTLSRAMTGHHHAPLLLTV